MAGYFSTRERLVHAARQAFASKGYAGASMDDLSASAGLTRGALYHQFGGKDGLLKAVVEQIIEEMTAKIAADVAAIDDPWARFRAGIHGALAFALDPEYQSIVLRDAPSVLRGGLDQIGDGCLTTLADLMARKRLMASDPRGAGGVAQRRAFPGCAVDRFRRRSRTPTDRGDPFVRHDPGRAERAQFALEES